MSERIAVLSQQIVSSLVTTKNATISEGLLLPGKAAMCTKIAASKSETHGSYGDIEAGIKNIKLVDLPPEMVLRVSGQRRYNGLAGRPDSQPQTEMVHYSQIDADNIVVRVHASALNYPDLIMTTHVYQTRPDPPFCLGVEGAGEVVHVGPKASYDRGVGRLPSPRIGDRVFVKSPINLHASRVSVPAVSCSPIPDTFDYDDAAGYMQGVGTSYMALVSRLQLKRGEWCIITGATGTIGLAGVQIAKKLGAKVIALGSDTQGTGRLEIVRSMGADHVIDYVKQPRWRDVVKNITAGHGADCVYDCVGGDAFMECVRAVSFGGRILVAGFPGGIPQLPMNLVLVKGLYICSHISQFPPNETADRDRNKQLLAWTDDASMRPHISHRFPLSKIQKALETMNERQHVGRIIVHPQDF